MILCQFWKEDHFEVFVSQCSIVQGIVESGFEVVDLFAAER